jgi:hypothetical protein
MEPNVDIKRLPPAQEKIKEKPTQQTTRRVSLDAESHHGDEKENRET